MHQWIPYWKDEWDFEGINFTFWSITKQNQWFTFSLSEWANEKLNDWIDE